MDRSLRDYAAEERDEQYWSRRLLAFGELLAQAMIDKRSRVIEALMANPLANRLPASVRDEAEAFRRLPPDSFRAPIETLRYCHRLAQLLVTEALSDQRELFEAAGEPAHAGPRRFGKD